MLLAASDSSPPPIPMLPGVTGRVEVGIGTFADASARAARFDVTWGAEGAAPQLVPISAGAVQLLADATGTARLSGIAGALALHAEDGPNRIGRITFALDLDAYVAARMLPRAEYRLAQAANPGDAATEVTALVQSGVSQLRSQDVDAEFLPRADEIVVGPEASQTLLGMSGDGTIQPATPTRATYVLRHELAHASQPVDPDALSRRETHVFEEGRADMVARGDTRLPEFGRRLALRFDAHELAVDGTYPFQRNIVSWLLIAAGMPPGTAAATQLLETTAGEDLPEAFADAIAARIGADPVSIASQIRSSSSSQAKLRQLLTMLGLPVA